MSVKKAYAGIVSFLEQNSGKKVSSILDEVIEMCSAKSAGSSATTVFRNEAGEVTHIRCGYFKQWLPLALVEFGMKTGSASGFNPMSKEGSSLWTKQQRVAKNAKEELLERVQSGDLNPADLGAELDAIETARTAVVAHPYGFETIEAALEADLDALVAANTVADVEGEDEVA